MTDEPATTEQWKQYAEGLTKLGASLKRLREYLDATKTKCPACGHPKTP